MQKIGIVPEQLFPRRSPGAHDATCSLGPGPPGRRRRAERPWFRSWWTAAVSIPPRPYSRHYVPTLLFITTVRGNLDRPLAEKIAGLPPLGNRPTSEILDPGTPAASSSTNRRIQAASRSPPPGRWRNEPDGVDLVYDGQRALPTSRRRLAAGRLQSSDRPAPQDQPAGGCSPANEAQRHVLELFPVRSPGRVRRRPANACVRASRSDQGTTPLLPPWWWSARYWLRSGQWPEEPEGLVYPLVLRRAHDATPDSATSCSKSVT